MGGVRWYGAGGTVGPVEGCDGYGGGVCGYGGRWV